MVYYIYKTTNLVNGKYYIGKHTAKLLDNDYLGSGKLLNHAIKKYGREHFSKEILGVFQLEWQMNLVERILVVVDKEVSYNLCPGGKGGFGYINKNGLNWTPEKNKKISGVAKFTTEQRRVYSKLGGSWLGRRSSHHTRLKNDPKYLEQFRQKMSIKRKGKLTVEGRRSQSLKMMGNKNRVSSVVSSDVQ